MKIMLLAVGKLKEKYLTDAVNEYLKRLSRFCVVEVCELPEGSITAEGEAALKKIKGLCVLFDIRGEQVSSTEFAEFFVSSLVNGKSEFTFIIGGSDGVSPEVKRRADKMISFGNVTYPHQLMRVIALEQIYRAMTINSGLPYHK